jgi:TRAP-type C4-dicarboxylate transport system permease large subunit
LTRLGALQGLENWLLGFGDDRVLFMAAFLTVILVAGMLADIVANLIILGPPLLAAAEKVGISDTQAAMVICVGFLLGTVTPPVGICYFAAARIAEEKLEKVATALLPFIGVEVLLLVLILLVPPLTEFVPYIAGFK